VAVTRVGFMFNPDTYPYYEVFLQSRREVQQQPGFDLIVLRVHSEPESGSL
jgi:hypothetical protein